jgi:WD40 repeat protein
MRTFRLEKRVRIVGLSFTPDGARIAAITSEVDDHVGSVVWLDAGTGRVARTLPLGVERCAIAPAHGKLAISYSPDDRPRGVKLVRWAAMPAENDAPAWVDVPDLPHNHVFALGFTPDGKWITIGCSKASHNRPWVHAIHVAPAGRGKSVTIPADELVGEVKFSPDGRWMVVTGGPGGDPTVRFHRYPPEGRQVDYTPEATRTRRVVFAPDRSDLVALTGKRAVLLSAGRSEPLALLDGHTSQLNDAAFTPDGRRLVTVSHDATARVWDAATGRALKTFSWSVGKLTAVAFSPDGLTCAVGGEKGQVVVWDVDG